MLLKIFWLSLILMSWSSFHSRLASLKKSCQIQLVLTELPFFISEKLSQPPKLVKHSRNFVESILSKPSCVFGVYMCRHNLTGQQHSEEIFFPSKIVSIAVKKLCFLSKETNCVLSGIISPNVYTKTSKILSTFGLSLMALNVHFTERSKNKQK